MACGASGAWPWAASRRPPATRAAAAGGRTRSPLGAGESGASCFGQSIPDAVDRQDVARLARVGLDLAAQVLDVRVDRPLVGFEGVRRLRWLSSHRHLTSSLLHPMFALRLPPLREVLGPGPSPLQRKGPTYGRPASGRRDGPRPSLQAGDMRPKDQAIEPLGCDVELGVGCQSVSAVKQPPGHDRYPQACRCRPGASAGTTGTSAQSRMRIATRPS